MVLELKVLNSDYGLLVSCRMGPKEILFIRNKLQCFIMMETFGHKPIRPPGGLHMSWFQESRRDPKAALLWKSFGMPNQAADYKELHE